jgi:hypothetical protein
MSGCRTSQRHVTKVRRPVSCDNRDRRGLFRRPGMAKRRRLLTGASGSPTGGFTKMWKERTDADPYGQTLAAYIANEERRVVLALAKSGATRRQISSELPLQRRVGPVRQHPHDSRRPRQDHRRLVARDRAVPALAHHRRPYRRLQPGRSSSSKRVGCGCANQASYQRRILAYATAGERGVTSQIKIAADREPRRAHTELIREVEMDTATVALTVGLVGPAATLGAVYLAHILGRRHISDKEQFRRWLTVFDRPAFKGPYSWKSDPKPFEEAIDIVIKAVNSGEVTNRQGARLTELSGIGKSQLRDGELRAKMDEVVERLQRIRSLVRAQLAGRQTGPTLAMEIDSHRDWIIDAMNQAWAKFHLRGLKLPTTVQNYEEIYHDE